MEAFTQTLIDEHEELVPLPADCKTLEVNILRAIFLR